MQLNSYYLNRCAKKLFLSKPFLFGVALSIFQTIIALFFVEFAIFLNVLFAILLLPFVYTGKKTPLKITFRVVRWLVVELLLLVALNLVLGGFCLPILVLPTVLLSWLILLPIESLIKLFYISKAQKKLKKMNSTVILITGSFGKTSTKNILNAFLSTKYKTICSPNSFNTPLGLAKFINQINQPYEYVILEGGAKQKGDIAKICKLFKPTHAIITGVAPQHLKTFKTLKNIIETKGEVLSFLPDNGICVLNADDDNSKVYFLQKPSALLVGKKGIDFKITDLQISLNGTQFDITTKDNLKVAISTPLLGGIFALDISFAYALATKLGCNSTQLLSVANTLDYIPHRLQLIKKNNRFILDDSYNANPIGVDGFLEVLNCFPSPKSVVSQGIVETGDKTFFYNYSFAKKLSKVVDFCAVLGQNKNILLKGLIDGGLNKDKIFVCDTLNEAVEKINTNTKSGGVIAFQNDLPDDMSK